MDIEVKALSTYSVAADGKNITLRVIGKGDSDVGLTMDVDQLGTLVMTLPALIEIALKRRFKDASLRYSFALGPSSLEQASDPYSLIFTLQSCDGFGVSFKISYQQALDLSKMLASSALSRSEVVAH